MTATLSDEEKIKALEAISLLGDKVFRCKSVEEFMDLLKIASVIEANCGDARRAVSCIRQFITSCIRDMLSEPAPGTEGVYVISYEDGHIKIGRTKDFTSRLKNLSSASASPVVRSKFFECKNSSFIEAYAHRHFKGFNLKNEFFSASFEDACAFLSSAARDEFSTPASN